jgi:hypothetical protein
MYILMVTTNIKARRVATKSETQTAKGLWLLTVEMVKDKRATITMTPNKKQPVLKTGRHMMDG